MGAQQEAMQPPRLVARSGNYGPPGRRVGRGRRLPVKPDGCERHREWEPDPPARPTQLSHSPNSSVAFPARSTTITPKRARPSRRNATRINPLALRAN